jgi:hypothetical protein
LNGDISLQKKYLLVVIILILMIIGISGGKILDKEEKQVSSTSEVCISLIMMVPDGTEGSRQKALLANWNLKEGKFSFQHEPLFFIETNNDFRPILIWDGGSRLFACAFGNQ